MSIIDSTEKHIQKGRRNQYSLHKPTTVASTHMEYSTYVKKKPGKLYGVLGVMHLDEDDNILMRGNLNVKNDISLSHK